MFKNKLPKIRFVLLRKVIMAIFIAGSFFGLGYYIGFKGFKAEFKDFSNVNISREKPADKSAVDFSLFWRVWDTLELKYYDKSKISPREMVYGAIKGMVASLGDPYTIFLPPEENKIVEEDLSGSFEGVGIQIGFRGAQLAVVAPLPESPAQKAGVEAGDLIVGIKDEKAGVDRGTVGITLPEAVKLIRGEAGTTVTLTLIREGKDEPFRVDIVRNSIDVPSITLEKVGENESIAHIRILKFSGETVSEWNGMVIELLKDPNLEGIIIDVRNDPGGYLQAAIEIASDFLDNGETVVIEESAGGNQTPYTVERIARLKGMKTVMLVNGGSASASEILSGALKDQLDTPLVGKTTFGKGTIQEPEQVDSGAGLHITIARWLTPDGTWVNEVGLTPDYELDDNPDTAEDEQLQKAIEVLKLE